jgi:hypothetical protein
VQDWAKEPSSLLVACLLDLVLNPEDGGSTLLRKNNYKEYNDNDYQSVIIEDKYNDYCKVLILVRTITTNTRSHALKQYTAVLQCLNLCLCLTSPRDCI